MPILKLVHKALPEGRLEALDAVATGIENLNCSSSERDFFPIGIAFHYTAFQPCGRKWGLVEVVEPRD